MDLIEEYIKIIHHHLDAPEVFIEAAAYHNVSALLGRFFRCSSGITGVYGMRPNVWFIISSIPGRCRRSTVALYSSYLYKTSLQKFNQNTFKMDEKQAKQKVMETIIEEGTPEGITDHINATELKTYTISSTEFGSVLIRMGTKEYELGVSPLFSKLYSGEGAVMMLSQRGKENKGDALRILPSNLYTTMYCGMQEPYLYISPGMSRQGLLRRIILVYCKPSDINRWLAPFNYERENVFKDIWNLSEKFKDRMIQYRDWSSRLSPYLLDITIMPDAMEIINSFAKTNDDKLLSELNNYNIYKQSYWEHLAKLSMLKSIARDGVKEIRGEYTAIVQKPDVQSALKFLDEATKHIKEVIANLGLVDESLKTSRDPIERIYQIIKDAGDKGIKRSLLYRKCGMKKSTLEELLRTLEMQEKIEDVQPIKAMSMGRTPVLYRVIA